MKMSEQTAVCPSGHSGAIRTISIFTAIGRGEDGMSLPLADGGGCACGGSCACGGH